MKLFLVCEGEGDDEDIRTLVKRRLDAHLDWIRDNEHFPEWHTSPEYEKPFVSWRDLEAECERYAVPRVHGQMSGWYRAATRALRLAVARNDTEQRVVLVHDADGNAELEPELKRAREDWLERVRGKVAIDVAIGVASPEHEAWVLAAFEPENDDERKRLQEARSRLGFDPTQDGHRLTSGDESAPKDAKATLRGLCEIERRRDLLKQVDLTIAETRGANVGLTAFLQEIDERVAPAFGHVKKPAR